MTAPLDAQQAHWREVLWPIEVDFPGVEGIIVPSGTTAERPPAPVDGYFRYNSTTGGFEGRISGVWTPISTGIGTFLSLTDTPGSYVGRANQVIRINVGESALEFTNNLRILGTGALDVSSTVNYETLVVSDDIIPNKKYVDDQDDLRVATAGDFMDGGANLTFSGGGEILGLPAIPTLAGSAASKAYVDALSAGLDPKQSVRTGTTDILDNAGNGVWGEAGAGVGATLTAGAIGTTTLAGVLLADGDRVLVKDEDGTGAFLDATNNGIYVASFTDAGSLTRLTRATDQDGSPANEVSGGNFTFIETGGTLGGSGWTVVFDGDLTVDTDSMNWTQFSDLGTTSLIADADADTKVDVEEAPDEDTIRIDTGDTPAGYGAVTDILTLASSGLAVAMGTANTSGTTGAPIDFTAGKGAGAEASAGGTITITGGAGGASAGAGGDATLKGGDADGGGLGGAANVTAGAGASAGGPVNITAGNAGTLGAGGAIDLNAGTGAGAAPGGAVTIDGGIGGTGAGGNGGDVSVTGGTAGAASAGIGGSVILQIGTGDGAGADGTVDIETTGAASPVLRLGDANGSDHLGLRAAAITTAYTLTFPAADAAGALTSDGGGNLSFVTPSTTNIIDADGDTKVDVEESADEDIVRIDVGDTPAGFGAVPNILTLASSGLSVSLGTANVANTIGAPISLTAGNGLNANGGTFTINAGDATGTSGAGGSVNINAGIPPVAGSGDGGSVSITAGDGSVGEIFDGGDVTISAGDTDAGGGAAGGRVTISAGDTFNTTGADDGGRINITAGSAGSEANNGGSVTIVAGDSAGDSGGRTSIRSGTSTGVGATDNGGLLEILAGSATAGVGGAITTTAGSSGGANIGGVIMKNGLPSVRLLRIASIKKSV